VQVHPHGNDATDIPISHFGLGVLTWNIPFLFRTPPGYNLLARGPANMPKDGIAALEGVVETDWTVTTFTMNWRFTRAHYAVTFEQDEPIAMIVPVRRGDLERFVPVIVDPEALPREHALFKRWSEKRRAFLRDVRIPGSSAASAGWERDYMLGLDSDGNSFSRHQTKLRLAPFVKSQESALEEDFQEPHW
jgi:hypothetical protein